MTFAFAFAGGGIWMLWKGAVLAPWALAVAAIFLTVSFIAPRLLRPLNRLWMRFGALLHRIVSPVVLGVIFFVVVTPVALVMRLKGRDALRRRFDPDASTYWIARDPPGPDPRTSFPRQF